MKNKILFDGCCKLRAKGGEFFLNKYWKRYHMKTLDREKVCAMIINYEWGKMIANNQILVIHE